MRARADQGHRHIGHHVLLKPETMSEQGHRSGGCGTLSFSSRLYSCLGVGLQEVDRLIRVGIFPRRVNGWIMG